jgi:hypothetical protein
VNLFVSGRNLLLTGLRETDFAPQKKTQVDIAKGGHSLDADLVDIDPYL